MKKLYLLLPIISLFFLSLPISVHAGEILQKSCPFSCKSLGIDKRFCKDWKSTGSKAKSSRDATSILSGNGSSATSIATGQCFVEIEAGAKGNNHKLRYPSKISCSTLKIPKSRCRDGKENGEYWVQF